ncbi:MAG TPA: hypothetical protein VH583_01845 [Vicinamibacterales bacterium]
MIALQPADALNRPTAVLAATRLHSRKQALFLVGCMRDALRVEVHDRHSEIVPLCGRQTPSVGLPKNIFDHGNKVTDIPMRVVQLLEGIQPGATKPGTLFSWHHSLDRFD